ncbi:MAG: hypothetical protein IPI67_30900 [Myxococcales bacterium]|nr:hypothetical protein [Myxococcales bacterium]
MKTQDLAFHALAWALVCPLVACGKPLNPDECKQLLGHYTELLVRQEHRGVTDDEVDRLKLSAFGRAAGSPEFARCPNKVSRSQFECAMQAGSVDEVERCLL